MGELGVRLKALRTALHLSQEALAERSGIDRPYLSRLETGDVQGRSWSIRERLAHGLGLPLELLAQYLDGSVELDRITMYLQRHEHIDESGEQPLVLGREQEDALPERRAASAFARANQLPEAAIKAVQRRPAAKLSPEDWYNLMKAEAVLLRADGGTDNGELETAVPRRR
jgi:transcriptional regulator with XRE-family HTH domain